MGRPPSKLDLLASSNLKMKFKILYLTYHPQIGGGETILLSLLAKLNKKKFEPIVIVTKKGQLSRKLESLKVKTYVLPLPGYLIRTLFIPGISPTGIYTFYKLCKKIKPDLIHINHLNLAIYAGISSKILKIPTVATSHGAWDSIYFFQDLISTIFVDRIMAITKEVKRALTKRNILNRKKVSVIPPGVDTNVFKPGNKNLARKRLNLHENNLIISIVGRIDPIKDHLTFLKAAEIVGKKIKNVTFFIVGARIGDFTGNNNDYENQIKNFINSRPSLRGKIVFGGFIESMSTVYQATDVLVSSSPSESFGLTQAETAACEIPIVACNRNLIVINEFNGYLVPFNNPHALAEKIIKLLKNKRLRDRFGKNGRQHVVKNFDLDKYASKVQNTYLDLLKGNNDEKSFSN